MRRLARLSPESAVYWAIVAALGTDSGAGKARVAVGVTTQNRLTIELANTVEDYPEHVERARLRSDLDFLESDIATPMQPGMTFPGPTQPRTATVFALDLEDSAAIDVIRRFVASPNVRPYTKREPLVLLAQAVDAHPLLNRDGLRDAAIAARASWPADVESRLGMELGGAPEMLLLAVEPESSASAARYVSRLLTGSVTERHDLCDALARRDDFDLVLVALSQDPAFSVKVRAAQAMAFALARRDGASVVLAEALSATFATGGPQTRTQVLKVLDGGVERGNLPKSGVDRVRSMLMASDGQT